jgi:hypothetical protein
MAKSKCCPKGARRVKGGACLKNKKFVKKVACGR